MEIPVNREDPSGVDRAVEMVLKTLESKDECWMTWTEYPFWIASETARRFLARGYHAKTCEHMAGNGPGWFWYGICIGKHAFSPVLLNKAISRVLG